MLSRLDLARRTRASGLHLLISGAVAAMAATLVFGLWYPGLYRSVSGGRDLFLLVTAVDVVLGPLLTLAVFNPSKGWKHLRRDLVVIGVIQSGALGYGLHTVFVVRPIAMVFEVDRFRVITANGVYEPELPKAPPAYRSLPLNGPWLLGTRQPSAGAEHNDAVFMGAQGLDRANRPLFWQSYAASRSDALARSRPVADLLTHYAPRVVELRAALADLGVDEATARFLPLRARGEWVVVLNERGDVVGHLHADGFF